MLPQITFVSNTSLEIVLDSIHKFQNSDIYNFNSENVFITLLCLLTFVFFL